MCQINIFKPFDDVAEIIQFIPLLFFILNGSKPKMIERRCTCSCRKGTCEYVTLAHVQYTQFQQEFVCQIFSCSHSIAFSLQILDRKNNKSLF